MMKKLTAAFLLVAGSASAATNISTTLNMTSPTGLISCTGVGCTVSATNGYFKNISGTLVGRISGSTVDGSSITSNSLVKAWATFSGTTSGAFTPSATYNLSSFNKTATGTYQFAITSGIFNSFVNCTGLGMNKAANGSPTSSFAALGLFPTTLTSQTLFTLNTSGGGITNADAVTIWCIGI